MSSFATASSRNPEPPNGRQFQYPGDPEAPLNAEAPGPETQRFETAANSGQPIDEVTRVERLISQLEARSMALVPYGYGRLPEVPTRKFNTGLLASVLVALWLTSVILVVAYMRYMGHSPAPERASTSAPFLITPEPDPQDQKVAASVDHLARALVSSSERMNALQAAVEKSNRDLQKIATKVNSEHAATAAAPADFGSEQHTASLPAAAAIQPKLPKNWHKVLDVKPTDAAVPHKGSDGLIDYWLVPRGAGTEAALSKVLPIGTSAEGVVVHNLEDGKDYTLTPAGEWRNGALTPGGN